jgi:NSS family neurotransmitter:Na+ symporter
METVVSIFTDKFGWNRKATCIAVFVGSFLIGIPSSLGNGIWANIKLIGMDFLTFFDFISNSVIMPIVALLTCILIGYVVGTKTVEDEVELTGRFKKKKLYRVIIKYVAPVCIVLILAFSVLEGLGIVSV